MKNREMFKKGLRLGMPIGLGYFPVSFTFGFLTVAGGLPWWIGVFISLTNTHKCRPVCGFKPYFGRRRLC